MTRTGENTTDPVAGDYPPTCFVRRWRVFADGVWKGSLYQPADVDEIVRNTRLVMQYMTPRVGLGHDKGQRLAQSLGMPSGGDVTGIDGDGRGGLYLDLSVPTWVGGKINAGLYPSGSVELKKDFRVPGDPNTVIPGRYLDGVALLGEENPAVKGCPPPRATFADGTPVPANYEPMKVPPSVLTPPEPVTHDAELAACFSEDFRVDPQQMMAAFSAMPDGPDKQAFAASCAKYAAPPPAGDAPPPAPVPGPSKPPVAMSDEEKEKDFSAKFAAMFADFQKKADEKFSDLDKKVSNLSAAYSEEKDKDEKAEMAAFSADLDTLYAKGKGADGVPYNRKLSPAQFAASKSLAVSEAATAKFSADVRGSAVAGLKGLLDALPADPRLASQINDSAGNRGDLTPTQLAGLETESMKRHPYGHQLIKQVKAELATAK